MKKLLLMLLLSISLLFPILAQDTATINLQGFVPEILKVNNQIVKDSGYDLSTAVSNTQVSTIVLISNKRNGFNAYIESENAKTANSDTPFFAGITAGNDDILNYSLNIDGNALTFTSGAALLDTSDTKTSFAGNSKSLYISYDGSTSLLYEDAYIDTLTITIESK